MRPDRTRPESAPATAQAWRTAAFGLTVRGDFAAPGLSDSPAAGDGPEVTVEIVPDGQSPVWPSSGERIATWRFEDGDEILSVESHPDAGFRMTAAEMGTHFIAPDGSHVTSVPPGGEAWRWQRYLVGQVLPAAALLRGYELLHASAVTVTGRAVAFAAASGVGKTSLAVNLIARGARFVTDDVVALGLIGGVPWVHPGPAVTNVRHAECARLGGALDRLGDPVGQDEAGVRIRVDRQREPLPLAALYLLERAPDDELSFTRLEPDFRLIAENGFNYTVSIADRLLNKLETSAAVAAHVATFRVAIPPSVDAAALAARVEDHVTDELA